MDKVRLVAAEVEKYLHSLKLDPRWFFRAFETEADGGFVWIHSVKNKENANAGWLLREFGYDVDLKPLGKVGIVLKHEEILSYLAKIGINCKWFDSTFTWEECEEDSEIRITSYAPITAAVDFLKHFGYGVDLKPLKEEVKKINMDFREKLNCDSCGKSRHVVHAGRSIGFSLCYLCLSEMVIFYEMEKEKRDSRTTEVSSKSTYDFSDWSLTADERRVWNERV